MGHERFNQEVPQHPLDLLHLLHLVGSRSDPLLGLLPCRVELQQSTLASPLDEHVWLRYKLGAGCEEEREYSLGGVEHALDIVAILEVDRCELCGRVVRGLRR